MSAFRELAGRVGLKALEAFERNKPKREARKARRQAKRKARKGEPLTPEEVAMTTHTEPTLRTSTKSGGTMGAGTAVIALVGVFFPEAMDKMSPETAAILASAVTAAVGWVVARVSKTATKPGML